MSVLRPILLAFAVASFWLPATPASADCPSTPDGTCKSSLVASFSYTRSPNDDRKDTLSFKMSKGASTSLDEFGDPTSTTAYSLCIYHDGNLAGVMDVFADGDCSDGSCWEAKPKGPALKDKTGAPDGIQSIKLLSPLDDDDKTKIGVGGKGANLPTISVPFAEPVAVQLRNDHGSCWSAVFSGPEQVEQDLEKGQVKLQARLASFPNCSDGIHNGVETDVDCGGGCPACEYSKMCNFDEECVGGLCRFGTCAATCTDGVLNGEETDVDCGHSCGDNCDIGDTCISGWDCLANLKCRNDVCNGYRVFVTSTAYDSNLGGLAGADAKCATRASSAGLGGTWVAWLSTTTVNAIDRINDYVYVNMLDQTVFANKGQLTTNGAISNPIQYDENAALSVANVWTATSRYGQKAPIVTCQDWAGYSGSGSTGTSSRKDSGWSAAGSLPCGGNFGRLYCFEQ
ncbi:MAG TPA: hypothetical protein VEL28_22545 [Candidatus Binatia bacterium]|nr:hypothetical protein [Candidatus Binatia bacterium]